MNLIIKSIINLIELFSLKKKIFFYFENSSSEIHFYLLLQQFKTDDYVIVTADKTVESKNFKIVNLYYNTMLIIFFSLIKKKVFVMTTPDLDSFHIKKNKYNKYIYIHHSMCSTHMIYREKAFDKFDYIFNVGDYQNKEIQEREKTYNLKKKILVNYGYGKLDYIKKHFIKNNKPDEITIAPSWYKDEVYLNLIDKIIEGNIKDYPIRFRPHPRSLILNKKKINEMYYKYKSFKNFIFDTNENSFDYILNSKYFISDWSGSIFEYIFFNLKPVLFLDVPKKINNINYSKIKITPIEVSLRNKIGITIDIQNSNSLKIYFDELNKNFAKYSKQIIKLRQEFIFNFGESHIFGSKKIKEIGNNIKE